MKIPRYYVATCSYLILHRQLAPLDVNLIIYKSGKALGLIQ